MRSPIITRPSGLSFSRIITLSAPVESEQIEAVAKDGVLTLTLPKRQEARPQKIEIRAE